MFSFVGRLAFNFSYSDLFISINICKVLDATDYYSGPAAKVYMDESKFEKEHIRVNYFDYLGYPEYNQLHGEFAHGVTIFDLIFNCGNNSKKYLKFIK